MDMEKKTKAALENSTSKDKTPSKSGSANEKLLKKKTRSEAKIYGKAGGKGG